jgi:hypothetical protein
MPNKADTLKGSALEMGSASAAQTKGQRRNSHVAKEERSTTLSTTTGLKLNLNLDLLPHRKSSHGKPAYQAQIIRMPFV